MGVWKSVCNVMVELSDYRALKAGILSRTMTGGTTGQRMDAVCVLSRCA
jgi:hypothetical protein